MGSGSYSKRYSRRRKWHVDPVLMKPIVHMIFQYGCNSLLDIGCGGHAQYVDMIRRMNLPAWGFDGTEDMKGISKGLAFTQDLTAPGIGAKVLKKCRVRQGEDRSPMLSICIEVGEHIPVEHESAVFDNLADMTEGFLMLSWALPEQRGKDHVNCRTPEYLVVELTKRGLLYCDDLTTECRALCKGEGWERKLLIFENGRA